MEARHPFPLSQQDALNNAEEEVAGFLLLDCSPEIA